MVGESNKRKTLCSRWLHWLGRHLNVWTSPEGCTAVDARKLHEYNKGLAEENEELKRALKTAGGALRGIAGMPSCLWSERMLPLWAKAAEDALREVDPILERADGQVPTRDV